MRHMRGRGDSGAQRCCGHQAAAAPSSLTVDVMAMILVVGHLQQREPEHT